MMRNGYTQRSIERKYFNLVKDEVVPYRCAFLSSKASKKNLAISKSHQNILDSSYYSQDKVRLKKSKASKPKYKIKKGSL